MAATPNATILQARSLMERIYKSAVKHWPGFQVRDGQKKMMVTALSAFLAHTETDTPPGAKVAIVEGQTGSGKTVGYLIPALAASLATGKQVIVSTATVALQEQLVNNDLPKLKTVAEEAGLEMRYAMAKGRGRYVCKTSLERELLSLDGEARARGSEPGAQAGEQKTIRLYKAMSQAMSQGKWQGDRDSWGDVVAPADWDRVQADRSTCNGTNCQSYATCAYYRGRTGMQSATVVITNHALVLSTLAHETGQIDPKASLFVFDEGHHLPEIGVDYGSRRYPLIGSDSSLRPLGAILTGSPAIQNDPQLREECQQARTALRELGGQLGQLYKHLQTKPQLARLNGAPGRWRFQHGRTPMELAAVGSKIGPLARQVLDAVQKLLDRARQTVEHGQAAKATELSNAERRLQCLVDVAKAWAYEGKIPLVKWVEQSTNGADIVLCASPLTAAGDLNRLLWEKAAGVLVTSATITACGSFEFFERTSGLARWGGRATLRTVSPFDYANQGVISFPEMRTTPKDPEAFTRELCVRLPDLLMRGRHGQMALFSSRRQMTAVYAALPVQLKDLVLMQGELPKAELLRQHKARIEQGRTSIIFGMQSLGEGVDLPGRLLEYLYIDKVPFAPPDSAVDEALAEWLEQQQRDAFAEIVVPKAAQKLAQWAGRGIRTPTDWARITIFDSRLLTATYGPRIMEGLPPLPVEAS